MPIINQVVQGGGGTPTTPIGWIPRDVDANGTLVMPTMNASSLKFNTITKVNAYSMSNAFYGASGLTGVLDLSSLTTISGIHAMEHAFDGCTGITGVILSSLTTISGAYSMASAFVGCKGLTSIIFSSLNTITGGYGMSNAFRGCTGLTSISFPALKTTSFGTLKTQFNGMLQDVTGCTVHFPSNLQSVLGSWTSVTGGFGGTNTTVLFDLPATA